MKTCSQVTKSARLLASTVATALLVSSCGGGSGDTSTATDPSTNTTEPTTSNAPSPTPLTCNPGPTQSTGFSEVFKECVGTLAVYYPLTECVKDNKSGLIWEQKKASGPQAANTYFTNFDSTAGKQVSNGGDAINDGRPATQAEINASYNSVGYINLVNGLGVCGGTWRLPNKDELQGLIQRIDPNWVLNHMNIGGYWSSSPQENIVDGDVAFSVAHHGMNRTGSNRENGFFVRLVRN
ncbi:MAG: DUF1566 domain-containing protein [Polaromonas sp.]|jgi:hypothetical protein|nr:DUF1566 domain-containing protein [Polaromonas sp.]